MAKASKAGRTKTRLSPPLSGADAARCNTAFLRDIAANLIAAAERADPHASIAGYMAYGPPGEGDFFDFLPPAIGLFEAWTPDFGTTLAGAIGHLLGLGHEAACVLNADSPTLPTAFLVEAARVLAEPGDRVVLGPSSDGGYYFLGLKRCHARLFADVTWSTEHVARQTLERAREIDLPIHLLPEWYDVDDETSLALLRRDLGRDPGRAPSEPHPAPAHHTRQLLAALDAEASAQPAPSQPAPSDIARSPG